MRLDLRATLTGAEAHESSAKRRPLVVLKFAVVGQPDLPPLVSMYAVDHPVARELLGFATAALGVSLPDRGTAEQVARILTAALPTREVVLECKTVAWDGRDRLTVRHVRPVPDPCRACAELQAPLSSEPHPELNNDTTRDGEQHQHDGHWHSHFDGDQRHDHDDFPEVRWVDRHEVPIPAPCVLSQAFNGEAEPQRRALHALERDVLCRVISDAIDPGEMRLADWEVLLLLNVWEALSPRSEVNR